jgi:F-type H+-transporting ATPase subunit a
MALILPPLAAEEIFKIGSFGVTNSLINSVIATVLFAIFAFFINLGVKKYYSKDQAPKGVLNFFESILEVLLSQVDAVTHDRKKTLKFLPIVGGIFLFILVSNLLGQLPGTGSIGMWHGHELIPFLRPANTDLNLTLGMAVFAVILSHFVGIFTIGFFKYANKFIKLGDIWHAVKSGKPINIMVAFIEFFVGLLEIISEVAKMVSLSLRLFGNIFAGEVLLTVIASLIAGYGAFLIPLPFMVLEILVAVIQAMVFSILTLVYLTIATTEVHGHDEEKHEEVVIDKIPAV